MQVSIESEAGSRALILARHSRTEASLDMDSSGLERGNAARGWWKKKASLVWNAFIRSKNSLSFGVPSDFNQSNEFTQPSTLANEGEKAKVKRESVQVADGGTCSQVSSSPLDSARVARRHSSVGARTKMVSRDSLQSLKL